MADDLVNLSAAKDQGVFRISHEPAAVDNEATEFQHTQTGTKGKNITSPLEQAAVKDKNITPAEAEGKIKVFTNKQSGAESKVEGTKVLYELAVTAVETRTTELPDERRSVITKSEPEDDSEITGPEFPHDPIESEGKIKISKQPRKQDKAEGEIKSTDFSQSQAGDNGKIKAISRTSHEQIAVDNEANEFQHIQTETKGKNITTKPPLEPTAVKDKNKTPAEAEGRIKAVTNKQAGTDRKVEETKLPCKLAVTEAETRTTDFPDEQVEAGGKTRTTEIAHVHEQAAVKDSTMLERSEGKKTETEFQHTQSKDQDGSTTTTLPSEQTEAENKIYQIKPPYDPATSEGKLEETEGKIKTTELPQDQANTEDETTTAEYLHKQKTITDKSTSSTTTTTELSHEQTTTDVITELPHKQLEAEEQQQELCTLQKIAQLLDEVVCNKRKLETLIDERKERYEVDFIITENFSINKGNFESELQMDMVSLNQALKQKQADKDNSMQKCDELSAQLAEQNRQLKEINHQLTTAGDLKLQLDNEVKCLSNTISKLKEEITAKQTEITKTNKTKKENQKCIAELEATLQNTNKKRSQLCDKKSTTESGLEKNNQSIEKLNEAITKNQKELENTNATISHVKEKKNEKQSDMDENEKSRSEHTKELNKIKADLEETISKCDNFGIKKIEIQSSLDRLDTEIEEICSRKSELQQACKSSNQKLILLKEQLSEHRKNIEKYEGDILKLEKDAEEFQESNNVFVLSCKVCLKLKIEGMQEKLSKGGFSCLKQLFNIWNDQIESLQKDLRQVSKKVEEHEQVSMTTEYLATSFKPIQVLQDTELTYLECLQSTTKISYILQATIQHCLCQINVDGFVKVIGGTCNSGDEGNDTNQNDTNQNTIIHLGKTAEVLLRKLLKIGNSIKRNFMEFSSTRFCKEKYLLECILEQEALWNKMQQLLKMFAQNVIDIETQVGVTQISVLFCYNYMVSESGLNDVSMDGECKYEEAIELLNKVYCSQNLATIVDRQLAVLEKDNEKLRSSSAAEGILSIESELECKESEMCQMETQKLLAQKDLDYTQEGSKELSVAKCQLQKEIQEKELNQGKLIQTLQNMQQKLHQKKSEMNDLTTKSLQLQDTREKLTKNKTKLAEHHITQQQLKQNLKDHQLQLQEGNVDLSTNDTKVKIITEKMHELQEIIQTIERNIKSYEKQMAQLDEIDAKKSELSKTITDLQEDINQHELNINHAKTYIGKIQSTLTNNASLIEKCKADEECKKAKICDTLNLLEQKNTEYNQIREAYIQRFVEMSIQKAVIGYQIEENEQNIKLLYECKCNLSYEETIEIKTITDKQSKFEEKLRSFELDLQEKRKALNKMEQDTKASERQIQGFENSNNNISDEQKCLDTKLSLKTKERLKAQQEQEAIEMKLKIFHQSVKNMSQKQNDHEKILTQLNSKRQEMDHEINNFLREISNLELKVKKVTGLLNNHKSNKSNMEHENKKLDLELKRIKHDLVKVDELLSEKSSILKDYQERKEEFQNLLDKLQKEVEETRKSMKQSEEKKKTAQKDSQKKLSESKILNRKEIETRDLLIKTEEDYRIWLQEKDNFQNECNKFEEKLSDIECINKQSVEVYSTLEELEIQLQSIDMCNSSRSILKPILRMVEYENILEKNKAAKHKKEKQDLEDHRKILESEMNEHIKKLENEIIELKKQNNNLGKEGEKLKNQKDIIDKENYVIKKEIQKLEQEIEGLKQTKSASLPRKIKGLVNLGNTCFFNSMLQGVNQVTMLYRLLRNEQKALVEYAVPSPTPDGEPLQLKVQLFHKPRPFAQALCTFYQEIDSDGSSVRPSSLLHVIGQNNSRFMGRNQQDSHEAFRCLLDGLRSEEIQMVKQEIYKKFGTTEQEYKRLPKKINPEHDKTLKGYLRKANKVMTTVDRVFGGRLVNTIVCHKCSDVTQTFEAFLDLSLPITKDRTISSSMKAASKKSICNDDVTLQKYLAINGHRHKPLPHDIELSLAEFTDLDELDDDNKFICKNCTTKLQQKTGKDDDFALCNVSKSLIIDSPPKILVLHIKRFYLEPAVRKDNEHVSFTKDLDITSYCTTDCKKVHGGNLIYTLFAVVVHSGSLQSGHYTAYVNVTDDKWYYTSDSYVSECSNGFKEVENCQAYMLFYKQS